jgi:hypothetical protein
MSDDGRKAVHFEDAKTFFLEDPLVAGLLRITGMRAWLAGLFGFVVFAVFMVGGGILISLLHGPDRGFLSLLDSRELFWVAFIYLLLAPIICVAYAAEPANIFHIFHGLWANGVITGEGISFDRVKEFLSKEITARQRGIWILVLILAVTALAALIWFGGQSPDDPFRFGAVRFWWSFYLPYFVLWIILNFSLTYMLLWIVLRRILAWRITNKALKQLDIRPKLRDPDGANGMSPIGDYFLRFAPLVALIGIWVAVSIVYPTFFGGPTNIRLNTVLFSGVYLAAIPLALIVPIWGAHVAMRDARVKMLRRLGNELQRLLPASEGSDGVALPQLAEVELGTSLEEARKWLGPVEALDKVYQIAEQAYRTWPFRRPAFLRSLLVAAGPFLSGGVSLLVRYGGPVLLQKLTV